MLYGGMSWNRRRLATREGLDPARERWNGNSTKNNVSGTGAWIVDVMVGTLRILLGSIEGLIHPAQNGRDGGFDGDKEGEREPLQDLGRVLFIERLVPETGLKLQIILLAFQHLVMFDFVKLQPRRIPFDETDWTIMLSVPASGVAIFRVCQ